MKRAIIIVALVLSGCGAVCQQQEETAERLRAAAEAAEGIEGAEPARESLEAAERALEVCEDDWAQHVIGLLIKVAVTALSN